MKILFTHRYFWPDTPPYALMLRTIARHFAKDEAHEVHVFASQPSYGSAERAPKRETLDGMHIARVATFAEDKGRIWTRIANVAIYCAALFVHVLRARADVVTAATFPPIAAAWSASLAAKLAGSKFVYHMQDVHPEVSVHSGGRLGRGLPLKLMRWLDNQTLRRADAIVVLSQDMANTVAARMPDRALPIRIVNNFQLESFAQGEEPPVGLTKAPGTRRIIFAGNMGKFQNLPLLVDGVARVLDEYPDVELLLLGDGEAKPALAARWGEHKQIKFAPFLPFAQAQPLIAGADIGLVSLSEGIYNVSYPSKVLTYIGLSLPMLALVEPDSALAREIVDNGLGTVPEAATPEAIADAARALLDAGNRREAVDAYHEANTRPEAAMARWEAVFAPLQSDRIGARQDANRPL